MKAFGSFVIGAALATITCLTLSGPTTNVVIEDTINKEYLYNSQKALESAAEFMDNADQELDKLHSDLYSKDGQFWYYKELCDSLVKINK